MKTLLIVVVVVSLGWYSFADDSAGKGSASVDAKIAELQKQSDRMKKPVKTRAELENKPEILRKTGGFVDVPAKGISVLVVDAREKAGGAPDQFARIFGNLSHTIVKVENAPREVSKSVFEIVSSRRDDQKSAFAMIVVEDEKLPGLSVQPEERTVVVNAKKYAVGFDPVQREERVLKELWRGLGLAAGIGYVTYKNDVLQPVFDVKEVDALEYQVMQPVTFMKIYETFERFGAKRSRHIPYRRAVTEGWAAAPTNDYQKAIWDKVHAIPTKPLKIQFDPKTDTK